MGIEPTTSRFTVTHRAAAPRLASFIILFNYSTLHLLRYTKSTYLGQIMTCTCHFIASRISIVTTWLLKKFIYYYLPDLISERQRLHIKSFFFFFTLYLACSNVGRGSLVLRHSVFHCPPNGGIACWVAEPNAALCLDTRTKKLKY